MTGTDLAVSNRSGDKSTPSGLGCLSLIARRYGLHLTPAQLVHDHVLSTDEVSTAQLLKCARSSGLRARLITLGWNRLTELKKALPAIVILKNGSSMVLLRTEADGQTFRVVLQDPNAHEDALLVIDRVRFEEAWTGEVVLVKRNYDITDETKPFSIGLVATLVFRERRLVREVAISAVALSFLALTPIIFWRLLSDRVLYYHAMSTFTVLCLLMIVLVFFETAFAALRRYLILFLTTRVDVKLSTYMFDKVLDLPIDFFERTSVGAVTHDMNEIWRIRNFLTGQLFGTVLDSFVLFVFFPVMFFFSPVLTAIVLACCVLIFLWIVVMLPPYRRRSSAVVSAETRRGTFLVQTIHGIRTVKSLALDARHRHEWDVHVARIAKLRFAEGMMANLIQTVVTPFERFLVSGTFALGVYFAMTTNDPVYIGALFAFLLLSQRVAAPLVQMAQLIHQYDEARLAVGLVADLVNQPPEEGRTAHGVRAPIRGHVEFSNVRFKYKGSSTPALAAVTFEVPQGTMLGIMGRSGSGKTTITRLLQRLHSNYQGLIKIDGIDVREYDVDHLRSSLGVVLQENFLFSGTIRENITAAKSDATFEEVVLAARMAGAEEFIDKLPRGYETYVYEGSPNLSGGQRQRLAIARALIVDPRILILDEATSALDAESEAIINANLQRIGQGRTLIVISHRLSSLVPADAILVLERGEVHDIGRHQELLERCDIYSGLWYQQNRHVAAPPPAREKSFVGPSVA
ncbi:MAG: peptidase domain-containing ABC transporter [Methylobacteriaceae bacterium]|nr:peptidase domain-containing ABC transporter [Methylobacteriaceae bacterium]MBV9703014.1 peptidase domain-containing ABC transporter [Methylobacteriaceae bacterium]